MPRSRKNGSAGEILGLYKRRMGEKVSRSTVSRVTKSLEQRVDELRRAKITEPVPYLYLDATFLDARWARRVENVAALVAYGAQESEASWADLLARLNERGLTGVKLVIADDHAGLKAAVRTQLPEAKVQRCTVHLTRNALDKTPWRLWRVGREVSNIFAAPTVNEARKRLEAFKAGLGERVPEATA